MTPLLIMFGIPRRWRGDGLQPDRRRVDLRHLRHWRVGNVDFKMDGTCWPAASSAGWSASRDQVPAAMGNADFVIKMTYVLMLGAWAPTCSLRASRAAQEGRRKNRRYRGFRLPAS